MAPEPESEVFEDGAFIVTWRCDHVPIFGEYVDDARDEVYYDEGPRCEYTERERFDLKRIDVFASDGSEQWSRIATGDDVFEIVESSWVEEATVLLFERLIREELTGDGVELQIAPANPFGSDRGLDVGGDYVDLDIDFDPTEIDGDSCYIVYIEHPETGTEYRLTYRPNR